MWRKPVGLGAKRVLTMGSAFQNVYCTRRARATNPGDDARHRHNHPGSMKTDIAIIGGGAIGWSAAYFLRSHPRAGSVCVIEGDPSYEFASTPKASGGARRLFSCPENIGMSDFSIGFFRGFDDAMAVDGERAHIEWTGQGYLFIVPPHGTPLLE